MGAKACDSLESISIEFHERLKADKRFFGKCRK